MSLTRSEIMRRVRRADTRPELALRRALHAAGMRYRLHVRVLGVRPDVVVASRRLAVFVDGCFWHGCPLHGRAPKGNAAFWVPKLAANRARDERQSRVLRRAGWRVVRIWEHDCSGARLAVSVRRVLRCLVDDVRRAA